MVKFKWKDVEQREFGEVKRIVTQNYLSDYQYFNKQFYIHTYTSAVWARSPELTKIRIK